MGGTWTNTPDGGYSYTPGFLGSAPPGGTYVPSAMTPSGDITPAHFDYPPGCTTCKQAKKDQDDEAARPARPYQLFGSNIKTEGTYESVMGTGADGQSTTYIHAMDADGTDHYYTSVSNGIQNTPGAALSAGTYASNGTADDYWLGAGSNFSKGPIEYGYNDAGYNMGLSASTPGKLDWSVTQSTGYAAQSPSQMLNNAFGGKQY